MSLPILLVSCYELGRQPLALAWASAFLERAGFEPRTLDLAVERADAGAVREARLVVVSVPMHTAMRLGARFAARVRELAPRAHVCFVGLYARLNADRLLGRGGDGLAPADSVIAGEGEESLVALARALSEGGGTDGIEGVETRAVRAAPTMARLGFPAPSRARLPVLARYAKLEIEGEARVAAAVEATRGCLHLCRHCPIPPVYEGRFVAVPVDRVLEDVGAVVAAGARHVTFADPDFLNAPAHARRVVEAMHARFPEVTFDVTAKVEHLLRHRDLLPLLAASGCAFVVSAVESLSDRVLAMLDKGHTAAEVNEALARCREAGLTLRPSLLPFTPWSTLEDYRALVSWVVDEDLVDAVDPVQLTIRLLVPPGSLLESHPEFLPHRGAFDAHRFSWDWTNPDPRMDALQREVTAVAEAGARAKADPVETIGRIAEAAAVVAGGAVGTRRDREAGIAARRKRAPRLTEPWFC